MRVITIDLNNKVLHEKTVGENCALTSFDYISDVGEIGQIRKSDGTFIDDDTPLPPQPPSETDLLKLQLKDSQQNVSLLNDTISGFVEYMFDKIPDLE